MSVGEKVFVTCAVTGGGDTVGKHPAIPVTPAEIATANGHPEWEAQIRGTFAQQWIASARSGWWYQDAGGSWKQK